MKISKYIHSCLVFEKDGFKLLIDPGKFSFAEGLIKPEDFGDVSAIIITHNHPDHLDADILNKIVELSKADIYTNAQVSKEILAAGLECKLIPEGDITIGPFNLKAISVKHEPLLDSPIPEMTALVIDGKVLHPVDSFEESLMAYKGIEVLILPTMAPFTTEIKIADFADRLKPKQIFPVHDGFAKDFFRRQRYENYAKHFKQQGIVFHQPDKAGDGIEV